MHAKVCEAPLPISVSTDADELQAQKLKQISVIHIANPGSTISMSQSVVDSKYDASASSDIRCRRFPYRRCHGTQKGAMNERTHEAVERYQSYECNKIAVKFLIY